MKRIIILFAFFLQLITFNCYIHAQSAKSEKIYLHTDRSLYIAGENIFLKLYVLDAETGNVSDNSKSAYVILKSTNSTAVIKARFDIKMGLGTGSFILPDTLQSGVYQFIAFTNLMKNNGEEMFFRKDIYIINRFDRTPDIKQNTDQTSDYKQSNTEEINSLKTDKSIYKTREKIKLGINLPVKNANLSVSVYEETPVSLPYTSLNEYFQNTPDTRYPESSATYYASENKGKILRGTVVDSVTNKTVKDAIVLLSCIDSVPNLDYAVTNSSGLFQLLLTDYYNGKELYLTIQNVPVGEKWYIKTEDEFSIEKNDNSVQISASGNYKDFVEKSKNIVYINKSYEPNNYLNSQHDSKNTSNCPRFYNCEVITVIPAEYEPLNNFSEIVIELLQQVRLSKESGKYRALMYNHTLGKFSQRNPAIFLDGVFVDDIQKLMDLGSEQIKKIDLITDERAFGDLIFGGMISVTSKTKAMINSKPASNSFRLMNDSPIGDKNYFTITQDVIQKNYLPCFKQLLYWNPNLEINDHEETLEFYTSDNEGNYIIRVEGITENGKPVSYSTKIQVSNGTNSEIK